MPKLKKVFNADKEQIHAEHADGPVRLIDRASHVRSRDALVEVSNCAAGHMARQIIQLYSIRVFRVNLRLICVLMTCYVTRRTD